MDESFIIPPEKDRADILKSAHEFGHFGAEAIVKKIRSQGLTWPKILQSAIDTCRACKICQKFTIVKRGFNPLTPLYCYSPGYHYQTDVCGPFPCTSSNNTYILLVLDVATRFVILRPIPDKSAKTVAKELVSIFCLAGPPRVLGSDRGGEYRNQILDLICETMKIEKRSSIAYYSPSNGGAERAIQNTKRLLSKLILGIPEDNWDTMVNIVQLMLNCKISKRLLTSPFNLMFARKIPTEDPVLLDPKNKLKPMDNDELLKRIEYMSEVVFPAIKERTEIYNKMMKNQFDKKHKLVEFSPGDFVVVLKKGIRKALTPVYEGPYEIIRKTEHNNYTLRDEMGLVMPRDYTPSELKLVSQDAVASKEDVYEFDAIVDHRGEAGKREYKIRWKNYSPEHDSWITVDMFTDPQAVNQYWRRIKGSIPKEDAAQLQKHTKNESNLPKFDKNKKGKILQQIETMAEHITIPDSNENKSNKNKSTFIKSSTRTKFTKTNPIEKSFRRSTRKNKRTVDLARDAVKYKK